MDHTLYILEPTMPEDPLQSNDAWQRTLNKRPVTLATRKPACARAQPPSFAHRNAFDSLQDSMRDEMPKVDFQKLDQLLSPPEPRPSDDSFSKLDGLLAQFEGINSKSEQTVP